MEQEINQRINFLYFKITHKSSKLIQNIEKKSDTPENNYSTFSDFYTNSI